MIDIDPESTCRICLEDGAIYPLFESNDEFEGMHAKLPACIREKIENIEGYPRKICLKCKNTSDIICSFKSKFEETCKILEIKIVKVKTEIQDSLDISDNDFDNNDDHKDFPFELQVDNYPVETKPEKRNTTELLESLKHLTVKKIKIKSEPEEDSELVEVKKRLRPRKATKASGKVTKTKPVASKATAAKPVGKKVKDKVAAKTTNTDLSAEVALRREYRKRKSKNTTVLCDTCGEMFNDKYSLIKHILVKHTEKKFKCSHCSKGFVSQSRLKEHLQYHAGRNHICELCGKGFHMKKNLNGHIRYVHKKIRKPPKKFKCQYCDRTYTSAKASLVHERSVHTGERPEVCSVCDSRFYHMEYLRQHMRIHTGETPYKCPVCNRGYSQLCNMKSHMRNHKISEQTPEKLATIKPNYLKFMRP